LDWLFLWPWVFRLHGLGALKIILKASLKKVPIFGWGMQTFQFLFLQRKWDVDEKHMNDMVRFYCSHQLPFHLLVFPEGTDLSPAMLAKSHEFSAQNKLPQFNHVLYPRVTGFAHLMTELKAKSNRPLIGAVYDVTIGYIDNTPGQRPSEPQLVRGQFPRAVHVHLKRYDISSLPDTANTQQWLEQRFTEKEQLLSAFYEAQMKPNSLPAVLGKSNPEQSSTLPRHMATFATWIVLFYGFFSLLFSSSWFRYSLIFETLSFALMDRIYGGFQNLELKMHATRDHVA